MTKVRMSVVVSNLVSILVAFPHFFGTPKSSA